MEKRWRRTRSSSTKQGPDLEFDFLCHSMSASADVYDEGPGGSTPPLPQEAYTVAKGQAKRQNWLQTVTHYPKWTR